MKIVKLTVGAMGEHIDDPVWCFYENFGDSPRTFCRGEAFGYGESSAQFEVKEVKRGGITCPICLEKIKFIKSIKL